MPNPARAWLGALIAAVVVGCGEPEANMMHADIVFRGGPVWTARPGAPLAEAVAVREGHVLAVGSVADVEGLVGPRTEVVELRGRALLPGFIDAHTHFVTGGFELASVDLRDAAARPPRARGPSSRR